MRQPLSVYFDLLSTVWDNSVRPWSEFCDEQQVYSSIQQSANTNKHLHVCWSETRINISIIAKPLGLCYNKNAPRGARPTRYLQPQSHRSMYPGPCITLLKWIIRFSQAVFQAKWYQTMIPIWYPELWELWEHREKHEFTSQNSLQTTITEREKEPREGTPKRVGIIAYWF